MSVYQSSRSYDDFFKVKSCQKYKNRYQNTKEAKRVFDWLQYRIDWLISSITNHHKPALQGVIVDLETEILNAEFHWDHANKDRFFITMIGAMARYLVGEFGFVVDKSNVKLRHNDRFRIISTATSYQK